MSIGPQSPAVVFAGLRFRGLKLSDVLPSAEAPLKIVVTVNADIVVTSASSLRFRRFISDNWATFDGQVTWWLAKLLAEPRGSTFEKLSGSSLAPVILDYCARHGLKVFFLGARQHVNHAACESARLTYGVEVKGYSPPIAAYPAGNDWNRDILVQLEHAKPDVLFVAFGSPKQELWLSDNIEFLRHLRVRYAIGCGGTLDFLSGILPRAPIYLQKAGLEGIFRFLVEPSWFRLKRLVRSLLIVPIGLWFSLFSRRS